MTVKKVVVNEEQVKPRTLLVQDGDGEFKITIPFDSHVTFGPTVPYEKKNGSYVGSHKGYSLRVYASKSKESLIAVFSDVVSFRDLSIPKAKLVLRESGKSVWKSDEDGYRVETEVKNDKKFVDDLKLLEPTND